MSGWMSSLWGGSALAPTASTTAAEDAQDQAAVLSDDNKSDSETDLIVIAPTAATSTPSLPEAPKTVASQDEKASENISAVSATCTTPKSGSPAIFLDVGVVEPMKRVRTEEECFADNLDKKAAHFVAATQEVVAAQIKVAEAKQEQKETTLIGMRKIEENVHALFFVSTECYEVVMSLCTQVVPHYGLQMPLQRLDDKKHTELFSNICSQMEDLKEWLRGDSKAHHMQALLYTLTIIRALAWEHFEIHYTIMDLLAWCLSAVDFMVDMNAPYLEDADALVDSHPYQVPRSIVGVSRWLETFCRIGHSYQRGLLIQSWEDPIQDERLSLGRLFYLLEKDMHAEAYQFVSSQQARNPKLTGYYKIAMGDALDDYSARDMQHYAQREPLNFERVMMLAAQRHPLQLAYYTVTCAPEQQFREYVKQNAESMTETSIRLVCAAMAGIATKSTTSSKPFDLIRALDETVKCDVTLAYMMEVAPRYRSTAFRELVYGVNWQAVDEEMRQAQRALMEREQAMIAKAMVAQPSTVSAVPLATKGYSPVSSTAATTTTTPSTSSPVYVMGQPIPTVVKQHVVPRPQPEEDESDESDENDNDSAEASDTDNDHDDDDEENETDEDGDDDEDDDGDEDEDEAQEKPIDSVMLLSLAERAFRLSGDAAVFARLKQKTADHLRRLSELNDEMLLWWILGKSLTEVHPPVQSRGVI